MAQPLPNDTRREFLRQMLSIRRAEEAVIGGAPTPRGVVCTTWLGGNARPCRKWSYIRSIAWMK